MVCEWPVADRHDVAGPVVECVLVNECVRVDRPARASHHDRVSHSVGAVEFVGDGDGEVQVLRLTAMTMIDQRPSHVEDREAAGRWESQWCCQAAAWDLMGAWAV